MTGTSIVFFEIIPIMGDAEIIRKGWFQVGIVYNTG